MSPGILRMSGNICRECGQAFYLTENKIRWYWDMGYILPKRCQECLKKRKGISGCEERGLVER